MGEALLKSVTKTISRFRGTAKKNPLKLSAILVYHGISLSPKKNCVLRDMFVRHLEYLEKNCSLVRLSELLDRIEDPSSLRSDLVSITFDDAYDNFSKLVYPEIVKREIPVALFVPAALTGQHNRWDHETSDSPYPHLKIMTYDSIRKLDPRYVEIGSHTATHRRMSTLSDADLRREIEESKKILEKELGRPIDLFAYPYGALTDFDTRAVKMLKEANYKAAVSTHFGRFNTISHRYTLRRISVWDDDTPEDIGQKLSGHYDWLSFKERLAFLVKRKLLSQNFSSISKIEK